MSTPELIAVFIIGAIIIPGGAVQTWRVWRHELDLSSGVGWATGETGIAGYHAFLLPGAIGFTLAYVGAFLIWFKDPLPGWADLVGTSIGFGGFAFTMLGFWLWLFMWPRFLVPPHLRGESGLVVSTWRKERDRRARQTGPGGAHRGRNDVGR